MGFRGFALWGFFIFLNLMVFLGVSALGFANVLISKMSFDLGLSIWVSKV